MPIEITMPQLSDTMAEGTVVAWKKNEGDAVKSGDEIAEIETDKATMPMEAFDEGTLAAILIPEGNKVTVGQVLAVLALKGEDVAEIKKKYAAGGSDQPQPAAEKPLTEEALPTINPGKEGRTRPADDGQNQRQESATTPPAPQPPQTPHPATAAASPQGQRLVASPLARRMAADMGVDLASVQGSGPNGRIVEKDIESAAAAKSAAPEKGLPVAPKPAPMAPRVNVGEQQIVSMTKMRATIAQRLQASKQNLPHFYESTDIDCNAVMELREKLNVILEKDGVRISLADFIAKALSVALLEHPTVNATFDGKQVTLHGDVNLGMAVALPDGLIVPVLRAVNQMGLKEIRQRTADLIDRARQQKLKAEEMSGGTFTISNLGNFGIREFTAIINPPEVAILAIGTAEKRAVVVGDQVVIRTMMTVTMSSDHRVVDGASAADFLRTFKRLMGEPGLMLV